MPSVGAAHTAGGERRLGFRLPLAVWRLYGQVANGGFGPGYGILGLVGGAVDEFGETAVDSYLDRRRAATDDPRWRWPEGLLPFCSWGCQIYSCIDCRPGIPRPPMVVFAPGSGEDWRSAFVGEGRTLPRWLQSWVAGQDPWMRVNALRELAGRPTSWPWDEASQEQDEPVVGLPGTWAGQLALL